MAVGDAPSRQVIRGKLDSHPITWQDADVIRPHFAGEVAEDIMTIIELDRKHSVRERVDDAAFNGNGVWVLTSWPFFDGRGRGSGGTRRFAIL